MKLTPEQTRAVLDGMCLCAEHLDLVRERGYNIPNTTDRTELFKPGVADKLLFRRLIQDNEEVIAENIDLARDNRRQPALVGFMVMGALYYSEYSSPDEQERRPTI